MHIFIGLRALMRALTKVTERIFGERANDVANAALAVTCLVSGVVALLLLIDGIVHVVTGATLPGAMVTMYFSSTGLFVVSFVLYLVVAPEEADEETPDGD